MIMDEFNTINYLDIDILFDELEIDSTYSHCDETIDSPVCLGEPDNTVPSSKIICFDITMIS